MKKESSAGAVEETSSHESSPRSPSPRHTYDYDDLPIDLRKKTPKENDIEDVDARKPSPDHVWVDSWHKLFARAVPPAPPTFGNGVAFPGHPVFAPHPGYPPILADFSGNRYTVVRTVDGALLQVPIDAERVEPPRNHENKENESCPCTSCEDTKNGDYRTLDLRKGAQDCPKSRVDKHSTPTLIRFLEGKPSSPKPEQDAPEDLSPSKKRPKEDSKDSGDDGGVKRSSSCPKLFEITSESLVERLMRERCKSDSEIQAKTRQPPPVSERPRDATLKRRILGGLAAADSEERETPSPLSNASTKQLRISPDNGSSPTEDAESVLLQQLRHLGPAAFPWSIYSYYAQLMQRMQDHEVLKRHLHGSGIPTAPSPREVLDEPDEGVGALDAFGAIRKRAPRALTGKHVKQGTGASPATLLTLRQKIQERQRAKELGLVEPTKSLKGRLGKSFAKVPMKKAVRK